MKSLQLTKPHLLVMVGIPGSGKTHFAEKFAETFGAPYVAVEKIRPYALDDISANVIIRRQVRELLKTRQTIIVDGGIESKATRAEYARMARRAGYEILLVWVQTDPATAKARVLKSRKDSGNGEFSVGDYERLLGRFSAPNTTEKIVVISGKHTYATQAKAVLKKLSEARPTTQVSAPPIRPTESVRRNITIR